MAKGYMDVSFVLVNARACDAESRKEERLAAAITAAATCGPSA